jgi:hypothetical protein
MKRYNVNLLAHYTISDAFEPFVEAKFVRVDTWPNAGPSFIQARLASSTFASASVSTTRSSMRRSGPRLPMRS